MASYNYPFSAFIAAGGNPAYFKTLEALEPLGFVTALTFNHVTQFATVETDHTLDAGEKSAMDTVIATVDGMPDIVPFQSCLIYSVATPGDLPSPAEMAGAGPCMVLIIAPAALAVWDGTSWKQAALS